jgi:hypothetical protein
MTSTPAAAAAVAVMAHPALSARAPKLPPQTDPIDADIAARRKTEARAATVALATAAALSVIRATVLPLMLAGIPPEKLGQLATFISPEVRIANYAMAGVFVLAALWAPRRPFYAAVAALLLYLCWAVPDVLHNPVLIGGGHIGKIVTVGILARAAFAGVIHRSLRYENMS